MGHTSDSSVLGGEQKNVTQWQELALPVEGPGSTPNSAEREGVGGGNYCIQVTKGDKRQFYVNG